MASKNLLVVLAIVAVALPSVAMAAEIWVGGDKGWTIDFDYQTWAKEKVFNVGDTLVFNYTQGHHNVIKATKIAFDSCIKPPQN
ncbi:unnamed protein product [Ilex paraguariensis]|uniref:Phytocyanin domain-containing protein n=2 Tax=Ilex paraguariensis TaxID=185542 RepID=A0ABC8R8H0_9AQUA